MQIHLSAASKTFLTGEYLALEGGPCLLLNTSPRFSCQVETQGQGHCHGIHPQSPAGRWMRERSEIFRRFDVKFEDLHGGQGGFGASSAQFLFVYAVVQMWHRSFQNEWDLATLLQHYRQLAKNESGPLPSGADVLSQFGGGFCLVQPGDAKVETLRWNFSDKDFFVIRTGQKVNTHEHLSRLTLTDLSPLQDLVQESIAAHHSKNWTSFCRSINAYYQELERRDWVASVAKKMVETINTWPEVEAVKSCGALGADTLVILLSSVNSTALAEKLLSHGWPILANKGDLVEGLSFHLHFSPLAQPLAPLSVVGRSLDV